MAGGGAVGGTAVDGTSDNPFIRYLVAAARPAGIGLTPDAARHYQRKSGGWLHKNIGAKAIDDISDSHSSPASAALRFVARNHEKRALKLPILATSRGGRRCVSLS